MYIQHLYFKHFRNLKTARYYFQPGVIVLEGHNGAGKTNCLEALYLCTTGKSFRHAAVPDLIHRESDTAVLDAGFERQGVKHSIQVALEGSRKRIKVDDKNLRSISNLLEIINIVAFVPEDLRIVKGSPEDRRRFMDRIVANFFSPFAESMRHYQRALKSRNQILRDAKMHHKKIQPALLEIYNEQLIKHGLDIHRFRTQTFIEMQPRFEAIFAEFMQGRAELSLLLQPWPEADLEQELSEDYYRDALGQSFMKDQARGMTTIGIHRADLNLRMNAEPAQHYASQGQQRCMVLAMKLAELECAEERLKSPPILLLDDVSSELDQNRTAQLFSHLESLQSQVWITTTGSVKLPIHETQRWKVQDGVLDGLRGSEPQ